jgi:hypothetical protein
MKKSMAALLLLCSAAVSAQSVPSLVIDAGSGSGAYAVLESGSTDKKGLVAIESGSSPAPDAGIFTFRFSKPRTTFTAGCLTPRSASAKGVRVNDFFPAGPYGFVVMVYYPGLEPHTRYVWSYEIGPDCAFSRDKEKI